jgi:ATP-binding cassette subfamily B multidrug efflux pump
MSDDFEDDLRQERIKTSTLDGALLRRMLAYAWPYRGRVALGLGLVLVSAAFAVMPPLLVGAMVDLVFRTGESLPGNAVARVLGFLTGVEPAAIRAWPETRLLATFGGLFLVLRAGAFLIDWGGAYLLMGLGQRVLFDIRQQLFTHIHSLSLGFFHRNPVGRLVNRVAYDVGNMERLFSVGIVTLAKDTLMLAAIVTLLLLIDLKLALIVISVIPLIITATVVFRRFSRTAYRRWYAAQSRLNAFMAETIAGVRVVQLFHREQHHEAAYDRVAQEFGREFLAQRRAWAWYRPLAMTFSATGVGLVLWVCGDAVLRGVGLAPAGLAAAGAISVGVFVSYLQYAELFFQPIRDIAEKIDIVIGAMTSAERIFTIEDQQPEVADLPGAQDFGRLRGAVAFEHVGFDYKPGEPVLRDLDFAIAPGQTVALVGHTGAGKTTIINLVNRLYDVTSGRVTVDGRDVRDYRLQALRRHIAVVHQDVFLFAGTVLENLTLGDATLPRERVEAACRQVGAHDFILRRPGGYDGLVEGGGKTFSAGERQLLSFARALVFDPAILILDEATSSIDTHSEELIQTALRTLTSGRTSIVIAHRLSTVQRADKIVVMHKGRLAEQGTHRELLIQRGIYWKLYRLQYRDAA